MSILGEVVLAADVEILPLSEVPEATRAAIPHAADDYAVSRPHSRSGSRIISSMSRDLLLEFRQPTRIVDAIVRFSKARGADPELTLDDAYPMLARFYRDALLVSPAQREAAPMASHLTEGLELFGVTLRRRVHALDDTEVFFGTASGRLFAVKALRAGIDAAEREADATRRAQPRAPEIAGVHASEGAGVIVSEWVLGEDASAAAAAVRRVGEARRESALLSLCCDVAEAIAQLHAAGVVHGDVNPSNVLIESTGRARVIDFGFAHVSEGTGPPAVRGGVVSFFEPELASAVLRGDSFPATLAGEQYSLGALLYLMWTGVPYVDWSLERAKTFRQIVESPPIPFARRQVPSWPALEAVLFRALAKSPAERFASCADLAAELSALLPAARARDEEAARTAKPARDLTRELTRNLLERVGVGGSALRGLPASPPYASVNYGAAGIAYALYKLSIARDDAELLAAADVWARKAEILAGDDLAFRGHEGEITEESAGKAALFHAPPGLHAVRALVGLAFGEPTRAAPALEDFLTASRVPSDKRDLTTGKASLLLGCSELLDAMDASSCDTTGLVARGDELRDELRRLVAASDFATDEAVPYLGIAHGWAGLLFALLRWSQARGQSAEPYRAKLDELAGLREPHGAGMRWPIHNRTALQPSYMDGWCNGAAGHALLWALAHERLGVAEYAVHAARAATSAWSSRARHGTICCGLAGIGYACAAVHRVTGDPAWLTRARLAARRACEDRSEPKYVDSLYKGALGATLLYLELDAGRPATPFLER